MKKRIVKKYHLKEDVKACLMFAWIALVVFGFMFAQAERVEAEKTEQEQETIVSVNFTR